MTFRRNDTHGRMAEHCKEHKVHFKYTHHFDKEESVFRTAPNLTALRRRFKPKNPTKGGKGAKQARAEQARAEEEAKRRQEEAQKLEQEAAEWLQKGEEEKRKAAQEAAEKAQEAANETEEEARQGAEEAKRKLDEELQKQEAKKIELPQQSIAETSTGQTQEEASPEVQILQVPTASTLVTPMLQLIPFTQKKGRGSSRLQHCLL